MLPRIRPMPVLEPSNRPLIGFFAPRGTRLRATFRGLLVMSALVLGCRDDRSARADVELPPSPPEVATGTTTSDSTTSDGSASETAAPVETCPCPEGSFCAAHYLLGDEPPSTFTCLDQCVPNNAASMWCGDDDSCCEPDARCDEEFGICRGSAPTTTGDASTSTSTGADDVTSTTTGGAGTTEAAS